ncbi:molybdopterin cofactor-binding domain-containing protein [Methylocapsa polymorpha]|uniref:Molybdopterin cofactor-binding domain-containing protein n=1 Tax=Methylocapsa polymorpha TaxID=3080828 RepID=A0ABZ0HTZ1_9HYPH|nr:molybdopterin cofactor-binding domain-containing protein [Methylocapsa sp. RX1]
MNAIANLSRRGVLRGGASSGFILGFHVAGYNPIFNAAVAAVVDAVLSPNVYVAIDTSGRVSITIPRSEMGTGIKTSLAQALADELDAEWTDIHIIQAQGDEKYGDQNTDGSRSVRQFLLPLRRAGASARQMLIAAAAQRWKASPTECRTQVGEVIGPKASHRLRYGDLVEAATRLPVPAPESLTLKSPKDWRYIGKPLPVVDLDDIVHGKAVYGIDFTLPGMKYASIERPPVYGATLKSYDGKAALATPGVERVVEIPVASPPAGFRPLGGVAIIASNTWAAEQGRQQLKIEWDEGPNGGFDSDAYYRELGATALKPGQVFRHNGDVDAALAGAAKRISADYFVPHLAHAMMEPEAAVAQVVNGVCEVWAATQNPQQARKTVAEALGVDPADVTINVTLLGGGFGRKSKPDYVGEAAVLAGMVGAPVKVTWTREDDIKHDYFHAACADHLEAGLNANGKTVAWLHRSVFPSIAATFKPGVTYGAQGEMDQGVVDMPYDIANVRCENGPAKAHVRVGWYRSVYNIPHGFALGSFVDELAAAASKDPVEHILELLGDPRKVDLRAMGVNYGNYGASLDDYPVDTARHRAVVQLAAERAGWGRKLPPRSGLGIAVHRSFLTYVAAVARVAVDARGDVSVQRIDLAVDCGQVLNPDRVTAQFEGAAVMGLGNTMFSSLTFKNGQAQQTNFADYLVARMDSAPETHVHIVPSDAPPGGVGEPGVPPVSAAICNAIYAATGRRIRALPVDPQQLATT